VSRHDPILAVLCLEAVLDIRPDDAAAANDLAWLLATGPPASRDAQRAVELTRRALTDAPNHTAYRNTMGVALTQAGRFREARDVLEENLRRGTGPADPFGLFSLAICHHRLGDSARAALRFDLAVRRLEAKSDGLDAASTAALAAYRAEAEAELRTAAGPH
jgi:Tfp pilus assembly protein PilF